MTDDEILKELQDTRGLNKTTLKYYKIDLKIYTDLHKMNLNQLLDEAEEEEEKMVRMRKRKIKKRLLQFLNHLTQENYKPSSIKVMMGHITGFYRTFEIETPKIKLPKIENHETINDIPTKDHIREAIQTRNLKHRAIILFMSSSGTGTYETTKLTVQDFINATWDYHKTDNILEALKILKKKNGIIPTFHLTRIKTNFQYFTFCSPEASEAIINYLISWDDIKPDDLLFKISKDGLGSLFKRINDKYQWGSKGTRRFFHAHSLRKFFATQLTKARIDHLIIEWMLGHSIPPTTAAYYKSDPKELRFQYLQVVDKLSISKVEVHDIKSDDYLKLEKSLEEKDDQIANLYKELELVKQLALNKDFKKDTLQK